MTYSAEIKFILLVKKSERCLFNGVIYNVAAAAFLKLARRIYDVDGRRLGGCDHVTVGVAERGFGTSSCDTSVPRAPSRTFVAPQRFSRLRDVEPDGRVCGGRRRGWQQAHLEFAKPPIQS